MSGAVTVTPTAGPHDNIEPIVVPADKSISHRVAMLTGLGEGTSRIHNYPNGADNHSTLALMRALGASIEVGTPGADSAEVRITGVAGQPVEPSGVVDCGNSGTTTRIGMGMVAGLGVTVTFDGDASLRSRPMLRVTRHLAAMGASVGPATPGADPDLLPITVRGGALGDYNLDNQKASAQVKSAVLLAGLTGGATVTIDEPHCSRDHSERLLTALGYAIEVDGTRVTLRGQGVCHDNPESVHLPGDPSSAAFWAAAAALCGCELSLPGVCMNPTRDGFFDLLAQAGINVARHNQRDAGGEPVADLLAGPGRASGLTVSGGEIVRAIDELPLLALLGMFVPAGETIEIRDAGELRVKETDRIDATADVVRAFGATCETGPDWIRVGPPVDGFSGGPVAVDARHDHRIAMGAAVAALGAQVPVTIAGGEVASVSYPSFWQTLERTGLAHVAHA